VITLSYWLTVSDEGLGNIALNRQNQAANFRKEIKAIQGEAETLELEAGVALWLRENRKEILRAMIEAMRAETSESSGGVALWLREILEKEGKHLERVEEMRPRENAA
jgi:hypothetical protein